MRSLRTATVALALVLWAGLAMASMMSGVCGDSPCATELRIEAAHCPAMGGATMSCCSTQATQPGERAVTSKAPLTLVLAKAPSALPAAEERAEARPTVATTGHGPPLYELFGTFLI